MIIASANVNTLLPWQEKCAYAKIANACMLSKVQLLEDQFLAAEMDVIAVQEGRANATVRKEGSSYTMMCAAAFVPSTFQRGILNFRTLSACGVCHRSRVG